LLTGTPVAFKYRNTEVFMANTGINSNANDKGDWGNNKELNPAANSSVTENGLLEDESRGTADSWRESRDVDHGISAGVAAQKAPDAGTTGDPGRTPGSAEGVDDFEETGNE
jgi:hypothetical protein